MKLYIKIYKNHDLDLLLWLCAARGKGVKLAPFVKHMLECGLSGKEIALPPEISDIKQYGGDAPKMLCVLIEVGAKSETGKALVNVVNHKRNEFSKNMLRYTLGKQLANMYFYPDSYSFSQKAPEYEFEREDVPEAKRPVYQKAAKKKDRALRETPTEPKPAAVSEPMAAVQERADRGNTTENGVQKMMDELFAGMDF